jgi:hypothetical protein
MPEIVDRDGVPWAFKATVLGLDQAFAAVPDRLLVEAYERQWTQRGLEPRRVSVKAPERGDSGAGPEAVPNVPREGCSPLSSMDRTYDFRAVRARCHSG